MRRLAIILAITLTACGGGSPPRPEPARFDLGPRAVQGNETGVLAVEAVAPSWLTGTGMQYRLLQSDPNRRLEYAESAWAASPAELVRQNLATRLGASGKGRCRLHVDLDEFVQLFDSLSESRFVLEGRAVLSVDQEVVASRHFSISEKADTPDARGGVGAAIRAVEHLDAESSEWVAQQASRCRMP